VSGGAVVHTFLAVVKAILPGWCIFTGFGFRSGVRSVSQSVSTIRARASVAVSGRAAFNRLFSFVTPLVGCVSVLRVIHLPVFGKHSRANKALGSDATPRTSCALVGAGQLKRYTQYEIRA